MFVEFIASHTMTLLSDQVQISTCYLDRVLRHSPRSIRVTILSVATSIVFTTSAVASSNTPTAGTPSQIKSAVAASTKIQQLPALAATQLATVGINHGDTPLRIGEAGTNCLLITSCIYGDVSSTKSMVLFGDSHMWMWMPAFDAAAKKSHYRLILLAKFGCPASTLPTSFVYYDSVTPPESACTAFHAYSFGAIATLKPKVVFISERTAGVYSGTYPFVNQPLFTTNQWKLALQGTIGNIQSSKTKVVVVEDVPFLTQDPISCLSVYASNVQKCSVAYPNPQFPGQQKAQRSAATSSGAGLIKTVQWMCNSRCSPVVGKYITHFDVGHLSTTYALYLKAVLGTAVQPYLK